MLCIGFSTKGQEVKEKIKWSVNVGKGTSWNFGVFDKERSIIQSDFSFTHTFSKNTIKEIGIEMFYKNRWLLNFEYQDAFFSQTYLIVASASHNAGTFWHPSTNYGSNQYVNRGKLNIFTLKGALPFMYDDNAIIKLIPKVGIQYNHSHWKTVVPHFEEYPILGQLPPNVTVNTKTFRDDESYIKSKNGFNAIFSLDIYVCPPFYQRRFSLYCSLLCSKGLSVRSNTIYRVNDSVFYFSDDYSYLSAMVGLKYRIPQIKKINKHDK